jgi:hypothetical protein
MAARTEAAQTAGQSMSKPMNKRLCLTIAGRIDSALQRELGEGIDLARMLSDPLYQRDVLLVCQAQGAPELTAMAGEFRDAHEAAQVETDGADGADSGFSPSRFFNSLFGALGLPSEQPPDSRERRPGRSRND